MDGLFPIIRRKRRPLVVAESVPDGPPKPPGVVATEATTEKTLPPVVPPTVVTPDKTKINDAPISNSRTAR